MATVDLRKVFDTYWKTKQASASLKDRAADMEKEHKNMLEDWKKAKEDYQGLLAGANDQGVAESLFHGTSARGRMIKALGAEVIEFAGGKIKEIRDYHRLVE